MKRIACSLLFFFVLGMGDLAYSNPFRTQYLCVPTIAANQPNLEFRIRDRGTCAEGESYMKIVKRSDGVLLIVPAEVPLSKEEQEDLDRYRKFFGGTKKME